MVPRGHEDGSLRDCRTDGLELSGLGGRGGGEEALRVRCHWFVRVDGVDPDGQWAEGDRQDCRASGGGSRGGVSFGLIRYFASRRVDARSGRGGVRYDESPTYYAR